MPASREGTRYGDDRRLPAGGGQPGNPGLTLTRTDAGKRTFLTVGDSVTIELAENPTTGYLWEATLDGEAGLPRPGRLVAKGSNFRAASDRVGSGGTRTLTFEADGEGEVALHLRLRRKWENEALAIDECDFFFSIGRRRTAASGRDE